MLQLITLGGLSLQDKDGHMRDRGPRRRALAVLAVVARAGSRGVTREQLTALFWPDSDEERARQVLRQTLYGLRKDVGEVFDGSDELRLDPTVIRSDTEEFERHLAAGRLEEATRCYGGAFLDGIHLRDAREFERWVDHERSVLSRQYYSAVIELARASDRRGDHSDAVAWWSRATDAFPLDGIAATGRVRALLANGQRVTALQVAEEYERRIREELEVEPDAAFIAAFDEARSGVRTTRSSAVNETSTVPRQRPIDLSPPATSISAVPATTTGRAARWRVGFTLGGAATLLTLGLFAVQRPNDASNPDRVRSLAVFPVRVIADSSRTYLQDGVAHLLTASFDGIAGITVLNARRVIRELDPADSANGHRRAAERLGAHLYVTGVATVSPDGQVQIDATLADRERGDRALIHASVRGTERDLFRLADDLARQLIAGSGLMGSGERASVAGRTTTSLAAYKAYLEGERLFRSGAYGAAAESYQRAITTDSTFALAFYRLSEAADWIGRGDLMMDAAERAISLTARLAPHDRLLFEAMYAWRQGDFDRADQRFADVVRLYPDDAEAWYQLGEVRFHGGPQRGRPFSTAVEAFERALTLDSTRTEALVHLVRIAATYGQRSRMDSLAELVYARQNAATTANTRVFLTLAHHDARAIDRLVDSMRTLSEHQIWPAASAGAQYGREFDGSARLLALLLRPPHRGLASTAGASLLSKIELARNRGREALAALSAIPNSPGHVWSIGKRALLYFAPNGPIGTPSELMALRDSLANWEDWRPPDDSPPLDVDDTYFDLQRPRFAEYPIGLLSLLLGDTSRAVAAAASLDTITGSEDEHETAKALANGIRAHVAFGKGQFTESLRLLELVAPAISLYHVAELTLFPRERYLRGLVLERLGRPSEALAWYESLGQGYPGELGYAGLATAARLRLTQRSR